MKWLSQSFPDRLTRHIIIVLMIIITIITVVISLLTIDAMSMETQNYFHSIMELTDEKMEKVLKSVEVSAVNNIDEVERNLESPATIYAALEKELKLNPHIIGYAAAFEPNYYPQQGKWFEPYVIHRDSNKIEIQQIGSVGHDYFKSSWYNKAIKSKKGYWTDPYFDESGAKMIVCSYLLPIHDQNGKAIGVFVADVSLDWLTEQLKEIDELNNENLKDLLNVFGKNYKSYSFIITKNGEYVAHPQKERVLSKNFLKYVKSTVTKFDDLLGQNMMKGKKGDMITKIDSANSVVFYSPLESAEWSMAIVVPLAVIYYPGIYVGLIILTLMSIGLLAVFIICRFTIRRATKPLIYLSSSTKEVAKGRFDTPLPMIENNDEIRQLRNSFEEMQQSLSRYVNELQETTAQKASMESELNIAKGIQMSMLPKTFPPYPERTDIDIYGLLTPAKAVGGDLYDFHIRDEHLYFCIGDVSGKGVPAALVMTVISTQFRTLSASENKPHHIVNALNKTMASSNPSMMFVTLFVGVIDLRTGNLKYCNAGHDAPLLINGESYQYLPVDSNVPVGVVEDWNFSMQQATIDSGDTIFLYTDGLTEAERKDHTQFGSPRIIDTIEASGNNHPEVLIHNMTDAIHQFVGNAEQSDDLTMLAIRYQQGK